MKKILNWLEGIFFIATVVSGFIFENNRDILYLGITVVFAAITLAIIIYGNIHSGRVLGNPVLGRKYYYKKDNVGIYWANQMMYISFLVIAILVSVVSFLALK